jgi:hypothetical protein
LFNREVPGQALHAFVIGCGRFPYLKGADRAATVQGARDVITFLVQNRDNFTAKLGSIECVLSESGVKPGEDKLRPPLGPFADADTLHPDGSIEPATHDVTRDAGSRWLKRCRPGDHMFFYMASHGVAETDKTAIGLLEDVNADEYRKWSNSLNVSSLATGLPITSAAAAWVFLDACQDLVAQEQPDGTEGLKLISLNAKRLAQAKTRSMGLVGSRFGAKGWAPSGNEAPFFTQALLEALRGACVEAVDGGGWAVSGTLVHTSLARVAEAALAYTGLETESLGLPTSTTYLLSVTDPQIPVIVRTQVQAHLPQASIVKVCSEDKVDEYTMPTKDLDWRLKLKPTRKRFTASAQFANGVPAYRDKAFDAVPPGQIVELLPQ